MKSPPVLQGIVSAALAVASLGSTGRAGAEQPSVLTIEGHVITRPGEEQGVDHWIGVLCSPLSSALRAHLNLPEGEGMVVSTVIPGGPAEKAGLQQYDVLVAADGKPLTRPEDLVEVIRAAGGKQMALTVLRSDERLSLAVSPEKRPGSDPVVVLRGTCDDQSVRVLQEWINQLKEKTQGHHSLRFKSIGAGVVVTRSAEGPPYKEFPDDLKITISKQGKSRGTIRVERGDGSWQVSADRLEDLPDQCRPYVLQFLDRELGAKAGQLSDKNGYRLIYSPAGSEHGKYGDSSVYAPSALGERARQLYEWVYYLDQNKADEHPADSAKLDRQLQGVERQLNQVLEQLHRLRQSRDSREPQHQQNQRRQ